MLRTLAAAAAIAVLSTPALAQDAPAGKPNILMIMGDDIGWSNVSVGDAPEVRATSIVIYPPSARFAAARLAAQMGIEARLDPGATHIKVLLGRDAVGHG